VSQKRQQKNLKRKKSKPTLSKFERKQAKIREEIVNNGLEAIRTNLLSSLDKNSQAYQQSYDTHHSAH